jgi:hypothetical protein
VEPPNKGDVIQKTLEGDGDAATDSFRLTVDSEAGTASFAVNTKNSNSAAAWAGFAGVGPWNHLCGTYDGAFARLYVNSAMVAVAPGTGAINATETPLKFGGCGFTTGCGWSTFVGALDEVSLWRRALRPHEIVADFLRESCVNGRDDNRNWRTDCADDLCVDDPACQ